MVITIDGPAAAGKSSAAKLLAHRLGYLYLDSGALYRAIAWKVIREGVDPTDRSRLGELCRKIDLAVRQGEKGVRVFVDGAEVTAQLRCPEVTRVSSLISATREVRDRLLMLQREIGTQNGVVIEGRDTGTVVFPHAEVKFYLDAVLSTRGERRFSEMQAKGIPVNYEATVQEIETRDQKDMTRPIAPLKKASDAIVIDSTQMDLSQVVDQMFSVVQSLFGAPGRNPV